MRRITTQGERQKEKRRNQFIVGFILIFLMLVSTLGYAVQNTDGDSTTTIKHNGYEFINQNGFWVTEMGGVLYLFRHNPKQTAELNLNREFNSYSGKPLYIVSDEPVATQEIKNNLNLIAGRIQEACLEGEGCEGDLPVKSCEDNVIIIKQNEVKEISQENNCVFLRGPQSDLVRITDEFLFNILNIQ